MFIQTISFGYVVDAGCGAKTSFENDSISDTEMPAEELLNNKTLS
jgi:hypothetical protein